jgi:hypothetical protein
VGVLHRYGQQPHPQGEHQPLERRFRYETQHRRSCCCIRKVRFDGTTGQPAIHGPQYEPYGLAIDWGKGKMMMMVMRRRRRRRRRRMMMTLMPPGAPRERDYYECYGHGNCLGFSGYFQCSCFDGYTGNCNIASCPRGRAWFDEPSDSSSAHREVECSARSVIVYTSVYIGVYRLGFAGYTGNCSIASCPRGRAWFDEPSDSSSAHREVECSARSVGDYRLSVYTHRCISVYIGYGISWD